MQQLSAQDASFVYLETPHTPMHIGSVGIYDPSTAPGGFVRFKDILRFIEQRLPGARSFRQRLVRVPFDVDHPYWIEDPEFDIEFHVRHIALPKPGDWRQLCIQVARLHARPMDLTKPLWEFTVVEGLDNIPGLPPGCFALVSKVHHAAIDGMSGVEMSAAVHDLDAEHEANPTSPIRGSRSNMPRVADLLTRSYFNNLLQPMRIAETIGRSLPGMAKLAVQAGKGDVSPQEHAPRAQDAVQRQGLARTAYGTRCRSSSPRFARSRKRCPTRRSTTSSWRSSAGRCAPTSRTRANCPRKR